MKSFSNQFEQLTEKQKEQVLKIFASCESKTNAQRQKEFERLEKIALKESYKGLFNIFNLIKKESTFLSIKGAKFQAVTILGGMNFNQFLKQMNVQGAYTFDEIFSFVASYEHSNEGDKTIIEERGKKINALIMDVKNGNLSKLEAVQTFVEISGAPFKLNKKGERKCTLTNGSVKNIFTNFPTLYRTFGLAEYFPTLHIELNTISEEVTEEELINA